MRKVRYLLLAAFVAACCGGAVSGCGKEDADSDSAGKKRVSVLMKVGTRSVDAADGTPTDAEAALHTASASMPSSATSASVIITATAALRHPLRS